MICLKPVDESSIEACARLQCAPAQRQFTNSPVWSLLQSAYTPLKEHCRQYAIWNDDDIVGMVRLIFTLHNGWYEFTDLLIDCAHQRKHYATEAIRCIIDIFREQCRFRVVRILVDPLNRNAIDLYEKCGFQSAGASKDGVFSVYEYLL